MQWNVQVCSLTNSGLFQELADILIKHHRTLLPSSDVKNTLGPYNKYHGFYQHPEVVIIPQGAITLEYLRSKIFFFFFFPY